MSTDIENKTSMITQFIHTKLISWLLPPTIGLFSVLLTYIIPDGGLNNLTGWKLILALAFITFSTVLTTLAINWVKLRLGTQQNTVASDKQELDFAEKLLKIAYEEAEKQRLHFSDALQELQRKMNADIIAFRDHYESRYDAIRHEKHDTLNRLTPEITELKIWKHVISDKLKSHGILVDGNCEFIGTWRNINDE